MQGVRSHMTVAVKIVLIPIEIQVCHVSKIDSITFISVQSVTIVLHKINDARNRALFPSFILSM